MSDDLTQRQLRGAIEGEIRAAFRGVTLGRGISFRQLGDDLQCDARSRGSVWPSGEEIRDDWSQVPLDELEGGRIAHLDEQGFRYYIPALMLSVLNHYQPSSMRVIATLSGLYPKKDNSWAYHMRRYSLLNAKQKIAIARFLAALPELVELGYDDQKIALRALRNYWGEYLQTSAKG